MTSFMQSFDTGEHVPVDQVFGADDAFIEQFLPPAPKGWNKPGPARGLYRCLRELGKDKLEAYHDVMQQVVEAHAR